MEHSVFPSYPRQLLLAVGLLLGATTGKAQSVPVGDALEDYARLLQLRGELPAAAVSVRPFRWLDAAQLGTLTAAHPWAAAMAARYPEGESSAGAAPGGATTGLASERLRLRFSVLPVEVGAGYNSARPWGMNDAARWQGRGGNTYASGGVAASWAPAGRWGRWSAVVRPVAVRSENTSFALSPLAMPPELSPWAYPTTTFQRIDAPQRFGADAYQRVDLGESFVKGDFGPVSAGLSNESQWWGTGRRNSLMLTNNGPGFGHAFVGTSRPVKVLGMLLEAKWIWGRLTESAYFDSIASNDHRFHTGAVMVLRPAKMPGLELGVSRIFVQDWRERGPSAADLGMVFLPLQKSSLITPENPSGDDERDQMAALFARWAMPESGFEVYGEWARGDHGRDLRDAFVEPEHASAYLLGFQKVFATDSGAGRWRLGAELTLLGVGRPSFLRAPPSAFYEHHLVRQGYTQRGQVIGAGIGPGGSQFSLGLDRFTRWGRVGGGFLRTVYDNDRFYSAPRSHHTHEVEPSFFGEVLWFRGAWDLSGRVVRSTLMNQWYVEQNDARNWHVGLSARWHPGAR